MVQEILSAAKTPTLSMALPLYEKLVVGLHGYREFALDLSPAIDAMIAKIEEYVLKSRNTQAYALPISMLFFWSHLYQY